MSQDNYMSGQANKKIVEGLTQVLSDTFVLYFKTHSFHWNVEGPHFKTLHELFEEQYNDLWSFTDELAERIRSLKAYAPTHYEEILKNAKLKPQTKVPKDTDMVTELADDNEAIVKNIFPVLRNAEDAGDEATVDMLIERIDVHEKAAWMLRSFLK